MSDNDSLSERDKAIVSQLEKEIERLDEQHRKLHIAVLDWIAENEDGSIEKKEQEDYAKYEEAVNDLQERIQMMLFDIEAVKLASLSKVMVNPADRIHKQLEHIENDLETIEGVIGGMESGDVKLCCMEIYMYEERMNGLKTELFHASQTILALDHADQKLPDCESSV